MSRPVGKNHGGYQLPKEYETTHEYQPASVYEPTRKYEPDYLQSAFIKQLLSRLAQIL